METDQFHDSIDEHWFHDSIDQFHDSIDTTVYHSESKSKTSQFVDCEYVSLDPEQWNDLLDWREWYTNGQRSCFSLLGHDECGYIMEFLDWKSIIICSMISKDWNYLVNNYSFIDIEVESYSTFLLLVESLVRQRYIERIRTIRFGPGQNELRFRICDLLLPLVRSVSRSKCLSTIKLFHMIFEQEMMGFIYKSNVRYLAIESSICRESGKSLFRGIDLCKKLEILSIISCDVSESDMIYLSQQETITQLSLDSCIITSNNIGALLGKMTQLKTLMLTSSTLSMEIGWGEVLRRVSNLSVVDVSKTHINSKDMFHLLHLPNLIRLDAYQTYLEGDEIDSSRLTRAKLISLRHCSSFLGKINVTTFRNVTNLSIGYTGINDEHCRSLSQFNYLIELSISCNNITSVGAELISKLNNLRYLDISGNELGCTGTEHISHLDLLILIIGSNDIGPIGCKHLSKMSQLTVLDISNNAIGLEGLSEVSKMHNLKKLVSQWNNIEQEGSRLISSMINLNSLDVSNNEIDDIGARYISLMNGLSYLDISDTNIHHEGILCITQMPALKGVISYSYYGIQIDSLRKEYERFYYSPNNSLVYLNRYRDPFKKY